MILYLICGEVLALLSLLLAPHVFQETARDSGRVVPWIGVISMVLVWPFTLSITLALMVRYIWRLR